MSSESEMPAMGLPPIARGASTNTGLSEDMPANLPSNVAHWLDTADGDEPAKPAATTTTLLFNGDTGNLRLETRRCLVSLLNGPSVDGRRQAGLWSVLLRDREVIQTYLHNIFLDLVIDVAQQVAFIRQVPDESETDIPILLRRHQLTLVESALVLFLRQRLTEADSANERAVVSTEEMVEHLLLFDQARNTDLARFDRQCDGAIKKCKALNLIRPIRSSATRFEVSPTLKLLFNAEDILGELAVLARMPGSKMGTDLITMRKLITDGLRYDEGALPFAGELIEVEPSEKSWTGPVERVLRNFSRTMLVPEDLHTSVAKFINGTNLRGRLVYLRMMRQSPRTPSPKLHGVYRKVMVSEGPFRDWIQTELLQNYDAECVETERELENVIFGITRAGLLKTNARRHEKDDRSDINNTRNWVLGGDTRSKAAGLQDRERELGDAIDRIEAQLEQHRKEELARMNRALHWQTLVNFSWNEIDHGGAAVLVAQFDTQIQELRAATPDLDILEAKIAVAAESETNSERKYKAQSQATMAVKIKLNDLKAEIESPSQLALTRPTPLQRDTFLQKVDGAGRKPTIETMSDDVRFVDREIGRDIGTIESEAAKLLTRIEAKFSDYARSWEAESDGLDPTMASYDEFDAKLTRLQVDDLPRFEKKFKELLNEQSNQHIALLSDRLEQERRDISDRMDTVNESLRLAEYNRGTYLVIEVEETTPPEAQELKAELRAALSHSLSMDDKVAETRFQSMKRLIKRLASQEPQYVNWKKLALDVRLHVEFVARELDVEGREVQTHRSGAGKSGGQRQKLTATCLAAALRYQLGGPGRVLPTFSTVFLDEAFDKADADFTDAAMKIFKSFGFQLIIATPIKSVMTIEPYVGGAVYIHIKDRMYSRALVLPYDNETQSIDYGQINGSSAKDEKS